MSRVRLGMRKAHCFDLFRPVRFERVRTPSDPDQPGPDLVMDVAELIWEPIAD